MQKEHIHSFLLRNLCWNGTFLLLKKNPKHTPVIKVANKEKRFSVFTDVYGSINLPDTRRQSKLVDGANVQTQSLQHQVPLTWNKGVMSQARKQATKFTESCSNSALQGCNLGTVSCSLPESPAWSCWKSLSDALQAAHYCTSQDVDRTAGWDVVSGVDLRTNVW